MINSPFLASSVYIGANASSLYHNIKATESSSLGAETSQGKATFPLKTPV